MITAHDWALLATAALSATLACVASYQLGEWRGYNARWVPPTTPPNLSPHEEPTIEPPVDLHEFLAESVTTEEIVAVQIATELSAVVLPELERQRRLTRRYRNAMNREKRKSNGQS